MASTTRCLRAEQALQELCSDCRNLEHERDESWGKWAVSWKAELSEELCLPGKGVEKGGMRGRGRARTKSRTGEGITKCLHL